MPLSGKLTSLFFASASVGGMFFPWLVGQLIDARGALVMIPSLLILVILSAHHYRGYHRLHPSSDANMPPGNFPDKRDVTVFISQSEGV